MFTHPGWYLVCVRHMEVISTDGPHDSPQGVATAMHLMQQRNLVRPDATYHMAFITDVAQAGDSAAINDETAAAMAALIAATRIGEEQ